MREYLLQYASTDRNNKKSHYNKVVKMFRHVVVEKKKKKHDTEKISVKRLCHYINYNRLL